jgi:ribosomal-protein-alanine N-acetyltransferase
MSPAALAALHAAAFTFPRPWTAEEFARLLERPTIFLVGGTHCFALGQAAAGEAELLTLATAPSARRRGLARAALAAFEEEARRRNAESAFLEVAETNLAAGALYAGAGYREVGRRPGYLAAPGGARQDALVLAKTLRARETSRRASAESY